ncbi:Maf family protein [Allokutzneria albata]|uniref:Nucleoside triphosphate pyrophosphatase n=1 Tax=Allokutzneria albata TaxID=211114 RepID=A0A1H0BB27_ALLAB|nr:nucleoside triphosphate pyrophosphatase [Allokutzneria albata]SDN42852.1 septum formation protein [Allokutzneria albata]
MRFVLASASPARRAVLRAAGIDPIVRVSGVDEDAVTAALGDASPTDLVVALAEAKAAAVCRDVAADFPDCVVVACDSMLLMDFGDGPEVVGKPGTADVARERWKHMAGGTGDLLTGHAVALFRDGEAVARARGSASTTVRFADITDEELEAYLATDEPLAVAGGFTLDGLGGWFVEGVDGDPSSVIGISLPLTRKLLAQVGVGVVTLWRDQEASSPSDG